MASASAAQAWSKASKECHICRKSVHPLETVKVSNSCPHIWCRQCLSRRFQLAVKSEYDHQVRCCEPRVIISVTNPQVAAALGTELTQKVKAKTIEYATKDRTYCHVPTCSTFINPNTITTDNKAICPVCQETTCAACKLQYYSHSNCAPAPESEEALAFEQWKKENAAATCPTCHRVILLSQGCNNIECLCKTEFCYECNAPWKTCDCPDWNEHLYLRRAVAVAAVEGSPGADVDNIARGLMEAGADCRHGRVEEWARFRFRLHQPSCAPDRERRCDDCNWRARVFLWLCRGCGTRVCTRCRRRSDLRGE